MTLQSFARGLATLSVIVSLIPVVIGAWRLLRRPALERLTWVWMTIAAGNNIWMGLLGSRGIRNNVVSEFGLGAYVLIAVYLMGELVESTRSRLWLYLGAAGFLAVWVWRAVKGDYAMDFSLYTLPTGYLMLAIAGSLLIADRIRRTPPSPLRDFGILIGLGTVTIYAPAVAITAISHLFYDQYFDALIPLWILRPSFYLAGLIVFTLAFAWTIPSRSSSGSSASAA